MKFDKGRGGGAGGGARKLKYKATPNKSCDIDSRSSGIELVLRAGCHHVRKSKTVLGSEFHAVDSGFQILAIDSSLYQWNLDFGFQSLVRFRVPCAVFWILKPRIPDSAGQIFKDSGFHKQKSVLDSGIRTP